jgi:hypothetical protein
MRDEPFVRPKPMSSAPVFRDDRPAVQRGFGFSHLPSIVLAVVDALLAFATVSSMPDISAAGC